MLKKFKEKREQRHQTQSSSRDTGNISEKKVDVTVLELTNLPKDGGDSFFFVLSYGQMKYRGKTVSGLNPKFQERASFPFDNNNREVHIEVWGTGYQGDRVVSSNIISLEMFLSVLSETPCDIPLKTQSSKVGGLASLLIHIYNENPQGYGQDTRGYGQQAQTGYPAQGPQGYPMQGGYGQLQMGGYPSYAQGGGYPPYGGGQAPYGGGYPQQAYGQQPMMQQQQRKGGLGRMAPWLLGGALGAGALGMGAYALGQNEGYHDGYQDGDDYGGDGGGDFGGGDFGGGDF